MLWLELLVICIVIYAITVIPRCVLIKRKLPLKWYIGLIPIYSHIKIGQMLGQDKLTYAGVALRLVGGGAAISVLAIQYYLTLVTLTHFYGAWLGNYTVSNNETLWMFLSTVSVLVYVVGLGARLLWSKKISSLFAIRDVALNVCGMVFPCIFELILACSKRVLVSNKDIKDMTREEYEMYCRLN